MLWRSSNVQTLECCPYLGDAPGARHVAAAVAVLAATLASRHAGPALGGAVAAFPATSSTLAVSTAAQGKRNDAANMAFGLINSLPCFLAFTLVIMATASRLGLWSFPAAVAAALTAAALTWYRMNARIHRTVAVDQERCCHERSLATACRARRGL
jgi:hypothetical protein